MIHKLIPLLMKTSRLIASVYAGEESPHNAEHHAS
jgi:hypothetical protein